MFGPAKAIRRDLDRFDVITATRVHKFKVCVSKTGKGQKEVDEWVNAINEAIAQSRRTEGC